MYSNIQHIGMHLCILVCSQTCVRICTKGNHSTNVYNFSNNAVESFPLHTRISLIRLLNEHISVTSDLTGVKVCTILLLDFHVSHKIVLCLPTLMTDIIMKIMLKHLFDM